ncbi:MAG: hypothetical protein B6I38_03330 [Anaerolineaceae bacterium 4572_5.1]|nr:MAG: hypothetical protein B6I38_03330 [Anaerolineaceae bacterium 4572_5.1]RLD06245.1 MAG: hypothetical protein DRI56_08290 [Chloroflexota bacterium]
MRPNDWVNHTLATEAFGGAHAFNQDISGWDVSSVANMRNMFANAFSFNQNIGN